MCLNFNTEGINLYFLCPFACFFFLVGASYSTAYSEFGQYPYTQNIIVYAGEILAIIPFLISMKIDKDIYQNKSEKISLKREINSSNSKKSLNIEY